MLPMVLFYFRCCSRLKFHGNPIYLPVRLLFGHGSLNLNSIPVLLEILHDFINDWLVAPSGNAEHSESICLLVDLYLRYILD